MTIRGIIRSKTASSFKPIEGGGYLLRTSTPWLVGTGAHYIVNEAQKQALIDVIPPRHPLLFTALMIAWGLLYGFGASDIAWTIFGHRLTMIDHTGSMIAAAALYYITMVVMIRYRLHRMAPILAEAVRTR